jgi:Icc-related predicted phosphoesterase
MEPMKILAVTDEVVDRLYSLASGGHFSDVGLILACGDLPYTYLEYLVTVIGAPLCYVPGNHDPAYDLRSVAAQAEGCENIDGRVLTCRGLLLAGLGGSIRYRPDGVNQYTQEEAYWRAFRLFPFLLLNRLRYGRALDILISHSPPHGIHDEDSRAHQGLRALNWLIRLARPRYHLHGHIHFHKRNLVQSETMLHSTKIINIYPYRVIETTNE